jgi:hypothetical protein
VSRRKVPWVLCAVSMGMLSLSVVLRWSSPAAGDDLSGLEGTIEVLGFVGIPIVGALIASRLPANPYGWLWCSLGVAAGAAEVGGPLARVADWHPWVGWLLEGWGFVGLLGLGFFLFALFPTGRLPSHRWRWVARTVVSGALVLFLLVPFVHVPTDSTAPAPWALQGVVGGYLVRTVEATVYVMFAFVVTATISLVLRFRRAEPVERRQLTWFMYAAVLNGLLIVLDTLGLVPEGLITTVLNSGGFLLLPVAVGAAMLRYRLFEIDRIVSRTVTYGLLTATIVVVYVLVVALLSQLGLPEGSSDLVVAAVTLAVAGLIGPVRRRLQTAVDRRFDRARYDAARAVDAFAARLRDQVDLDEVASGLRDTVVATVAPSRVAVWLRVPSGTGRG